MFVRSYEVMFILKPELEEAEVEKISNDFVELIKTDGEVEKVTSWGKRRFAYPINHVDEGYYQIINFKTSTKNLQEVERRLSIHDSVIRHMIVRTDES